MGLKSLLVLNEQLGTSFLLDCGRSPLNFFLFRFGRLHPIRLSSRSFDHLRLHLILRFIVRKFANLRDEGWLVGNVMKVANS